MYDVIIKVCWNDSLLFHLLLSQTSTLSCESVVLLCGKPHMATLWGGSLPNPARTAGAVLTEGRVAIYPPPCAHVCAGPNPRQRQKLAQINNSAGSQIQFAISLRAITIKFIDCNQSNSLIASNQTTSADR